MNESDWLASADANEINRPRPNIHPDRMLQFLRVHRRADKTKLGRRKLRLFACACCRRFWSSLSEESRTALGIAERYADGGASKDDLGYAWRKTVRQHGHGPRTADAIAGHVVEAGAMTAASLVPMVSCTVVASKPKQPCELWYEKFQQAAIIYDLFGNPFRNTLVDSALQYANIGAVRDLADHMYQRRDHDGLVEIATTLEKAGCTNAEILGHCHQPKHFHGCWLLDALRGIPS